MTSSKRNIRAGVADRWMKTQRTPDGKTETVKSDRHGVGMRWRARYVPEDGIERSKSFDLKKDAQAWLDNEITPTVAAGTYVVPQAGRITVGDVFDGWMAAQGHISAKSDATRRSAWNVHVQPVWANVPVADVRTSAVRLWVATMVKDETGPTTIESAYGVLRQVLGTAVEDKRIARNPCEGVPLPKRDHADRGYLTHAQVAALADAVERNPEVPRFLAYTGLRWGEMAALRVCDFDMLRRRVNISRSVTEAKVPGGLDWGTPKEWERRTVRFPATLADELSALMIGKGREDLVFNDMRGGVLRNSNWRSRVFDLAVAECQKDDPSFPTITPHDLRHTAASLAISAGANPKGVQRMLGHRKASMTMDVYADLFDADLDLVANALDVAMRADAGDDEVRCTLCHQPLQGQNGAAAAPSA